MGNTNFNSTRSQIINARRNVRSIIAAELAMMGDEVPADSWTVRGPRLPVYPAFRSGADYVLATGGDLTTMTRFDLMNAAGWVNLPASQLTPFDLMDDYFYDKLVDDAAENDDEHGRRSGQLASSIYNDAKAQLLAMQEADRAAVGEEPDVWGDVTILPLAA